MIFRNFNARIEQASNGGDHTQVSDRVVTLPRFQKTLGPHEVALYVAGVGNLAGVGGAAAYMCVRRDAAYRSVRAVDAQAAQRDSHLIQLALTADYAPSAEADAQFPVSASLRLYDVLIRPFEQCLHPGDHIIWLPELSQTQFPLSVLLNEAPPKLGEGYDLSKANWLIRRYSVSYAGAASVIVAARSHVRPRADFDFLGVGDPLLSGTTDGGEERSEVLAKAAGGSDALAHLTPLPETKAELSASAQGFPKALVLTEGAATVRNLRNQLLGSYRFLSFATHGLVREDAQGLSDAALVLTPGSADPADNGLLTASEIADLNLSADFVALSACNTANVDFSQMPEDLPALSSAFAIAGVPATLGTLWSVNSDSASRIVPSTIARLGSEPTIGPAEALAEAQRQFLASPQQSAFLHPRFWAPFVVLGDGGAQGRSSVADPHRSIVAAVETLSNNGGEVLGVSRAGDRLFERFISDRNAKGRFASAVRVADARGHEFWRKQTWDVGGGGFVAGLGPSVVAGGYQAGPDGHSSPTLEVWDAGNGTTIRKWVGATPPGLDGFLVAGIKTDPDTALFATVDRDFSAKVSSPAHAHFFEINGVSPTSLFEATPGLNDIDEISLATDRGLIVIAYTERLPAEIPRFSYPNDTYDAAFCASNPKVVIEVRDLKTGSLTSSLTAYGVVINKMLTLRDGEIVAAGARVQSLTGGESNCELKAAVMRINTSSDPTNIYVDPDIGASEFNDVALGPNGLFVAVGRKENVIDYYASTVRGTKTQFELAKGPTEAIDSGIVTTLGKNGAVSQTRMLDAGLDVSANTVDATDPRDMIVGGMVGDHATIFHITGAWSLPTAVADVSRPSP